MRVLKMPVQKATLVKVYWLKDLAVIPNQSALPLLHLSTVHLCDVQIHALTISAESTKFVRDFRKKTVNVATMQNASKTAQR
jgi:hypothetical protein